MTAIEQIEHSTQMLLQLPVPELNEVLDTAYEIDPQHTLTGREMVAQAMLSISRNPIATKDCRARALQMAKAYLKGSETMGAVNGLMCVINESSVEEVE